MKMKTYFAYGLNLLSEIDLPELLPAHGEPDISIYVRNIDAPWEKNPQGDRSFRNIPAGILLTWHSVARFLVCNGNEIIVEPVHGSENAIIRHLILGPVLGVLLYQRGFAIFHASAIVLQGGGAAFLAHKGNGKSALAATFVHLGRKLINDDLLVLNENGQQVWATPGIPQLKLWPETLAAIAENPQLYPKIHSEIDKRALLITDQIVREPVPLGAIYVLETGLRKVILPLEPKEALRRVMSHSFGALFQGEILSIFGLKRHFQECVSLVNKIPVYLLKRPLSLDLLPEVCQAVECHFSNFVSTTN
jgi:hypothetical protein